MMRDDKLTDIMFRALQKDASLAKHDEWIKAADWAIELRFFPHALHCLQLALELEKKETTAEKLNDVLDKITNVLEFIPEKLKLRVEEIRLNNPIDPSKWLAISNALLQDLTSALAAQNVNKDTYDAAKFALCFTAYCSLRSGNEVGPINDLLHDFLPETDLGRHQFPKLDLKSILGNKETIKVVALGDNVTLGLTSEMEVKFQETYHYMWSKDSGMPITLANNAISGSGVLDLALYLGRDAIHFKPDIALLCFGNNDAWLGKELLPAYQGLYECCINMLKEHDIEVVVISPIPHITENCPEDLRPTDVDLEEVAIEKWAETAKQVAANTGVHYADALSLFPKEKEKREALLENKFNQPNLEGHKLIKRALEDICA